MSGPIREIDDKIRWHGEKIEEARISEALHIAEKERLEEVAQ